MTREAIKGLKAQGGKMINTITCKVCGGNFHLKDKNHYIARDSKMANGFAQALSGEEEPKQYDAFDCPYCGSQYIAQERKRFLEISELMGDEPYEGSCEECEYQETIDARRYTFGNDEFSLEDAYHDCKLVFDGITDDDSLQEADTGLILYYANEIIYALQEAIEAWNKRADEPQMWTPVSEKPKTSGLYNCTCYDGVTHRVTTLKWSNGWMLSGRRSYWKVLAWMPLPKPYRDGIICGGLRRMTNDNSNMDNSNL